MPQTQCPLSPGKGGKPSAKSPIISVKIQHGNRNKIHTPFKIFNQIVNSFFRLKLQRIKQNSRSSPTIPANYAKFATKFMHIFTKYFQIPDHRQRTPGNWSESRRFRAFRPEFQRITRNSPTWPAICQ